MTHLDLFSGIGGFALAARMAGGIETIGFSEIDTYASSILKRHWPDVPNYGDIRNVRGVSADLVTGGFPCQPFSVAGKRRGAADDRALWPEMLRTIAEAKPRWVLGENVAGIINMELDRVLSDLEAIGYAAWPIVIPACGVDARHRRDRVWIVAHAGHLRGRGWAEPNWQEYAEAPDGGEDMAHAELAGLERQRIARGANPGGAWPKRTDESPARGRSLANAVRGGRQGSGESDDALDSATAKERQATELRNGREPAIWCAEPRVGRVANGIPHRAHRLRALGNAIVPQVAAEILRALVTADASSANVRISDGGREA